MGPKSSLDGVFPVTEDRLVAEFVAWTASQEASSLANRLAWAAWDVDELVSRKEILEKDLLGTAIDFYLSGRWGVQLWEIGRFKQNIRVFGLPLSWSLAGAP